MSGDAHSSSMRQYHVYIMASLSRRLYIGVTNDLGRRMAEHTRLTPGAHTARYRITRLVYLEETSDIRIAIAREKQLKGWPRLRKCRLIETVNPDWRDLRVEWDP